MYLGEVEPLAGEGEAWFLSPWIARRELEVDGDGWELRDVYAI